MKKKILLLAVFLLAVTCAACAPSDPSAPVPEPIDINEALGIPKHDSEADARQAEEKSKAEEETKKAKLEDVKANFATEIVVSGKMTLDNYLDDYKISLAPQNWTIADFDEDGAIMATTKITKKDGEKVTYLIVLTPIFEDFEYVGAKPHYVQAGEKVYGDDGYCDEYFAKLDEEDAAKETSAVERSAPPAPVTDRTAPVSSSDNNYNTYNETDRANTTAKLVLNTSSKKIHNPGCPAVPKISPDNYLETNESVEALEAKGYEKCGMKDDWYN